MGAGVLTSLLADAGLSRDPAGGLVMDGVPLEVIADAVGTPSYVYHAGSIRSRYHQLDAAFGDLPHRICYAVKANGNLAVLRQLQQLGAGADIVSGGELLRALGAGFAPRDIVFSGVGKTDEELQAAIAAGVGHINVESVSELRRLTLLAEMQGAVVSIGVRLNPDVTAATHPYISTGKGGLKFGIPLDQLDEVMAVLDESTAIRLDSLAMHLGSQLHSSEPYLAGLAQLTVALDRVRSRGHAPTVLDIGGGLGIQYRDEDVITPDQWLAPLREALVASGCVIHVEPGRYLVGSAGVLLSRVVHRKHSGGREIAIVDAGMNDLLRPSLYRAWHEIVPVRDGPAEPVLTDVVGPVCETGDFLALDRMLAPVPTGGLVAVLGAGAYAFVMSSNYNTRARAAEIMVDDARWAVVRPRERLGELFDTEVADPFAGEST